MISRSVANSIHFLASSSKWALASGAWASSANRRQFLACSRHCRGFPGMAPSIMGVIVPRATDFHQAKKKAALADRGLRGALSVVDAKAVQPDATDGASPSAKRSPKPRSAGSSGSGTPVNPHSISSGPTASGRRRPGATAAAAAKQLTRSRADIPEAPPRSAPADESPWFPRQREGPADEDGAEREGTQ
jgi:hypothetical protein